MLHAYKEPQANDSEKSQAEVSTGPYVEYSPKDLVRLFKKAGRPVSWATLRKALKNQVYPNQKIHHKLYRFPVGVLPMGPS